jgi:glycosyltransferase involved in cell wall biosynthesis
MHYADARSPAELRGRTILQIVPELDAGGAERTAVDIAAGLVQAGARALVATEGGRLIAELQAKGGSWIPFPAKTKNPLAILFNARKLKRIIREEEVDLVHARSRAPAWSAYLATGGLGVPFVTTYHGSYQGRSSVKILYNSVMARGDAVIANSHYTARLIAEKHPFARDRIAVIHRGTDLKLYSATHVEHGRIERLRAAWGVAPHQRVILCAARLTPWKGQKVLIEAARLLREAGENDIAIVLAGDDQGRSGYVRELDAMAEKLGVKDLVYRVGHCTDMPAAFMAAAVVAVPSTEPEAFGRTATEAQALGTPVVVTDLGAVPETVLAPPDVIAAARTGWRIPPNDPEALAEALSAALNLGATARDAMAHRSRQHVERHFSLESMVGATLRLYVALLERQRANRA